MCYIIINKSGDTKLEVVYIYLELRSNTKQLFLMIHFIPSPFYVGGVVSDVALAKRK